MHQWQWLEDYQGSAAQNNQKTRAAHNEHPPIIIFMVLPWPAKEGGTHLFM